MALSFAPRGVGDLVTLVGAAPGVGAEYSLTVPPGEVWRINSVRVQLVTSVNAIIRTVQLVFSSTAPGEMWFTGNNLTQAASLTNQYSFAIAAAQSLAVWVYLGQRRQTVPLPDTYVGPGGTIATLTENLQGNDQYGAPILIYQRWRN